MALVKYFCVICNQNVGSLLVQNIETIPISVDNFSKNFGDYLDDESLFDLINEKLIKLKPEGFKVLNVFKM